jgi:hypothetical protein
VRDDARIVELGHHAIRHVARALAGAARQQHDVGERQRLAQRSRSAGVVGVMPIRRGSPPSSRTASASTWAFES